MKGIAHFVTGVTAASFFPWSVEAALEGNPLYFVLGGAFGLLPDTLDFKIYRFFYRHDVTIGPEPGDTDPGPIARALAGAVGRAAAERRTLRVKLQTLQLGADAWRQYRVRFDPANRAVDVAFGPVVNTGQVPLPAKGPAPGATASAPLPVPVVQTYDALTTVDIFDGPSFGLEPTADGRVRLHFLPWHRDWSHSLTGAAAAAALGAAAFGWRAAPVIFAGLLGHVIEDQLGFMGSNLFFPFTRRRAPGVHLMRSGDALPNFLVVWFGCLLIFWNLYRFAPDPGGPLRLGPLLLLAGILPVALGLAARWRLRRGGGQEEPADTSSEWGDPSTG